MEIKKTKKVNVKEKSKTGKKCRGCGMDCSVVRALALGGIPDSHKKEQAIKQFGSEKPAVTPETCKKK